MEESGWKNVHGDVFRPPRYPMILSSMLGSGIQLFCMVLIVICESFCGPNSLSHMYEAHQEKTACFLVDDNIKPSVVYHSTQFIQST